MRSGQPESNAPIPFHLQRQMECSPPSALANGIAMIRFQYRSCVFSGAHSSLTFATSGAGKSSAGLRMPVVLCCAQHLCRCKHSLGSGSGAMQSAQRWL